MHTAVVSGTVVWFVAVGLLWYARPSDVVWLVGSLLLGAIWFAAFAWYVTRRQ